MDFEDDDFQEGVNEEDSEEELWNPYPAGTPRGRRGRQGDRGGGERARRGRPPNRGRGGIPGIGGATPSPAAIPAPRGRPPGRGRRPVCEASDDEEQEGMDPPPARRVRFNERRGVAAAVIRGRGGARGGRGAPAAAGAAAGGGENAGDEVGGGRGDGGRDIPAVPYAQPLNLPAAVGAMQPPVFPAVVAQQVVRGPQGNIPIHAALGDIVPPAMGPVQEAEGGGDAGPPGLGVVVQPPPAANANAAAAPCPYYQVTLNHYPLNGRAWLIREIPRRFPLQQLCVGWERHYDGSPHAHVFLQLRGAEYPTPVQVRRRFEPMCPHVIAPQRPSINVKPLRTKQARSNSLQYVCKWDRDPTAVNVCRSKLSWLVQLEDYTLRCPSHQLDDPWVVANYSRESFIAKYHGCRSTKLFQEEEERNLREEAATFADAFAVIPGENWLARLQMWCANIPNAEQLRAGRGTFDRRRKNLFLWGRSGVGKTHNLSIFLPHQIAHSYTPVLSSPQFAFSGLEVDRPAIYCPDTDERAWVNNENREAFLCAGDGRPIPFDRKHQNGAKINYRNLVILVSNFPIPALQLYEAFANRFTIIHANRPWQECVEELAPHPPVAVVQPPPPEPLPPHLPDVDEHGRVLQAAAEPPAVVPVAPVQAGAVNAAPAAHAAPVHLAPPPHVVGVQLAVPLFLFFVYILLLQF